MNECILPTAGLAIKKSDSHAPTPSDPFKQTDHKPYRHKAGVAHGMSAGLRPTLSLG